MVAGPTQEATMPKLTPTQESLLKTAAGSTDRAIRWPDTLRGGARTKIITALVEAGLAENNSGSLVITNAGLEAVGMTPETPKRGRSKADKAKPAEKAPRKPRTNTKQAQMIAMLHRTKGATIEEMATELGWQHHTIRGAMAGALKKKLGLDITSEKVERRGRVYRIAG